MTEAQAAELLWLVRGIAFAVLAIMAAIGYIAFWNK